MSGGRDAFDAALIPGMRARLADAYREFRAREVEQTEILAPPADIGTSGTYRVRDCPLCGADASRADPVLSSRRMTLVSCRQCDFTYSREVMDEATDTERYRVSPLDQATRALRLSAAYLEIESARARYYLEAIAQHVRPSTLLEIGSGYGTFLLEASRVGWQALGIEPGASAAAASRERGAHVVEGYFPEDLPRPLGRFGLIAALDVLEHMADPIAFLSTLRKRLAPGGRLFVQVPNWDSLLVRLEGASSSTVCPGHWSYFTPVTLQAVLAQAGFRALHVETVQSELDRQNGFPPSAVEHVLALLRPGEWGIPDPSRLHELRLGYKLIGIFGPDDETA